ncbi:MAG: hypothetical protein J6V40_05395, partial [Clostridia bacterium]|nr:hypothetical protein [Clostridia bacterium]
GVVKYSYHYMKGVGEEDSDTKLYVTAKEENYKLIGSSIGADSLELYVRDKVEIKVLPTWIGARNVWDSNTDTDDNYGYPYIKDTYITGTVVVSSVDISSIIQNNLYSNDEFTSDDLSIQYSFFKNMNDDNSVIVSTPGKLYSILSSAANSTLSNQIILITKDLDMSGYELTQVISYNYATIVGAVLVGNTYRNAVISNLTIKGGSLFGTNYGIMAFLDYVNLNVSGDTYVASICVHNKGTISHVNIRDSYIYGNSYVGGIASYNSVPSNITSNVGIYYVSLSNVEIYNGSSSGYTGGIAAVNEGSTTRNYTHGIVDSSVVGLKIYSLGSYCGGIVGRNYGKITDVIVRGHGSSNRLTITVSGGSYVGGIAGYTTVEITGNNNSVSYVNISGNNYIGGYYGYSLCNLSNARISDVILTSTISNSLGMSYVGGFVGYTAANITVGGNSAIRLTNIEISARGYYIGGLVGYMEKRFGHIRITSSTATISMDNINIKSGSAYVGGILGKAKEDNVIISGYDEYNPISITGGLYIKTQDVNSETAYIGGVISACASVNEDSSEFTSEISYIDISAPLKIESKQVTNYVGGITGYAKDIIMNTVTIASGYSLIIDVPKANSVGGIVGYYSGDLDYDDT